MCDIIKKIKRFFHVKAEEKSPKAEASGQDAQQLNDLETLRLRYEFLKGVYDGENQRRRTVEHKASLLIGSLSMMGAVIVGAANFYSNDILSQKSLYIVFYTASLAVGLCFTLYYAIRTLKKRTLTLMDTNDQENITQIEAFYTKMISNLSICIKRNKEITNLKVDEMEMSQNWFYIVLLSIGFYFVTLFIQVFFAKLHWNSFVVTFIIAITFLEACYSLLHPLYKKN